MSKIVLDSVEEFKNIKPKNLEEIIEIDKEVREFNRLNHKGTR